MLYLMVGKGCGGIFEGQFDSAQRGFLEDLLGVPLIPNLNRVVAAPPDFLTPLDEAVGQNNAKSNAAS